MLLVDEKREAIIHEILHQCLTAGLITSGEYDAMLQKMNTGGRSEEAELLEEIRALLGEPI